MSNVVVEIHVPLAPAADVADGEYGYPWIDDVEERLAALEESGEAEVFDDGEEDGDEYVFFVTGASEEQLLKAASVIASSEGVPGGMYAVVTSDGAEEFGTGKRVPLPLD